MFNWIKKATKIVTAIKNSKVAQIVGNVFHYAGLMDKVIKGAKWVASNILPVVSTLAAVVGMMG